jgi:phage/plasmid-associated DNA primase
MSNYEISRRLLDMGKREDGKITHCLLSGDPIFYSFEDATEMRGLYSSYLEQRRPYCGVDDAVALEVAEIAGEYVPAVFYFRSLICLDGADDMSHNVPVIMASALSRSVRCMGKFSRVPVYDDSKLNCVVLNRIRQDGEYDVMDIIFHFPDIVEKKEVIKEELYPVVCRELSSRKFEQRIDFQRSMVFSYYDDPVPLYGSATEEDAVPFSYSGVVTCGTDSKLLLEPIENFFPLEVSALYKRGYITETEKLECQATPEQLPEYWIPAILSLHGHEKATSRITNDPPQVPTKYTIEGFSRSNGDYEAFEKRELETKSLRNFIDCWNPWRIDHETEWILIGEAIFNIYDADTIGTVIWREITNELIAKRKQRLEEFGLTEDGELLNPLTDDPEEQKTILNKLYDNAAFKVPGLTDITERNRKQKTKKTAVPAFINEGGTSIYRKYYYKFVPGRQTLKSVASNAREDDATKYAHMHMEWCKNAFEDSTSCRDTHIARALYRYLWLDWFCETIKDNVVNFYYLHNNRIHYDPGQVRLKNIIVTDFVGVFKKMKDSIKKEKDVSQGDKKVKGENLLTKIEKVIDCLENNGPKKRYISESSIFFNVSRASSFFNENCDLTCVNTGVLVAGPKGILFRKGRLEDFITKRTAAFYLDDIQTTDPGVKAIMKWTYETFLKDTEMIHWWWMFFSSMLRGGNDDKIFPYVHGEKGNEGKSAWVAFFDTIFGEYSWHVDISYFTDSPKDANSATPVTASLKGTRLIWVEEAEDTKPIQAGPLKKKTGKDKLPERGLFKDAGVMTFQGTFVGVGNDIPPISNAGLPVKERLCVVPILSQRSADAPKDVDEQYRLKLFPRDNAFDREIEYLGSAGLTMLVQYYGEYIERNIKNYPKKIRKYTDRYWEDKDKYYRFTKDEVDVTNNKDDVLKLSDLYESFKDWHEKMYPKTPIPNNDELRRELRNRWGKMKNGNFLGVKLKKQQRRNRRGPVAKYDHDDGIENI